MACVTYGVRDGRRGPDSAGLGVDKHCLIVLASITFVYRRVGIRHEGVRRDGRLKHIRTNYRHYTLLVA